MNDKKIIFLIFLLALILRAGYTYFFIGFNAEEIRDGTFFNNIAVNIADGKGITLPNGTPTAKKPPAYLIFLGGLYYVFGYNIVIGRIAQCLIGALVPVIIFFITRELYPSPVEKIASLITACYPPLVFFCGRILVEPFLVLSTAIFVLAIVKIHNPDQYFYLFLSGIFLAISILTRPLLIFLPFFLIFLPFLKWNNIKKTKLIKAASIILIGFNLIYFPWVIRNYIVFNKFVPVATETGLTLWLSNHPQGKGYLKPRGLSPRYIPIGKSENKIYNFPSTRNFILDQPGSGLNEKDVDDKFLNLFLTWLVNNPIEYLKLIPYKLIAFWDGLYLLAPFDPMVVPNKLWIAIPFIFIMPLAIYGFIDSTKDWRKFLIFYLIFINIHILILLTHADYRMRSIIMPYFFIFAGRGVVKITNNLHDIKDL